MHPLWNHSSTRGKRTEVEQSNASEKSEKQPVDKYRGRVKSVIADGEIQTPEAFVRQVVEIIQGVIEAKLTPAQPPPVTMIPSALAIKLLPFIQHLILMYLYRKQPMLIQAYHNLVPQSYGMLATLLQPTHIPL